MHSRMDLEAETPLLEHVSSPWGLEKKSYSGVAPPAPVADETFPMRERSRSLRDDNC